MTCSLPAGGGRERSLPPGSPPGLRLDIGGPGRGIAFAMFSLPPGGGPGRGTAFDGSAAAGIVRSFGGAGSGGAVSGARATLCGTTSVPTAFFATPPGGGEGLTKNHQYINAKAAETATMA